MLHRRVAESAASAPTDDSDADSVSSKRRDDDEQPAPPPDDATADAPHPSILLLLLGLGVVTRFYGLGWPREVVFDEVHFGKFVSGYVKSEYFFDIHPPLGKLLMSIPAWWSGYDGSFPFLKIGDAYPPSLDLFSLRALPAAFGAVLVPLMYALALEAGCSPPSALVVASMILFDGATFVESRLILTDSILFFFELLQLWAMLKARAAVAAALHAPAATAAAAGLPLLPTTTSSRADDGAPNGHAATAAVTAASGGTGAVWRWLLVTGVGIGGAISTKHTGFGTMAIVGLESIRSLVVTLVHCVRSSRRPLWKRGDDDGAPAAAAARRRARLAALRPVLVEFCARFATLLVLPAATYLLSFVLHLWMLPNVPPGNPKAVGFHTEPFTCRMRGPGGVTTPTEPVNRCVHAGCERCEGVEPLGLLRAIWVLNKRMLSANAGIKTGHHDGSGWLHWPLGITPVYYWTSRGGPSCPRGAECKVYMASNPVVWRAAIVGGVALVLLLLAGLLNAINGAEVRHPSARQRARRWSLLVNGWLLVAGYLIAWLPFAWVERVAFLYHYIPPLLLSMLATGLAFEALTARAERVSLLGGRLTLRGALALALAAIFLASFARYAPLYTGWPVPREQADALYKAIDGSSWSL